MSHRNKRRLTESSVHREDTISDLGILDKCASPYSRQFSEPGGDWSRACVQRFSAMSVPPKALAKLHQTHELLKAEGNLLNILEDTNEAVIDKVWSSNSWHVMPQMPRWSKEASHAVRPWRVSPAGANGAVMLQSMGIGAVNTKGNKGHGDRSVGQDCCSISLLPSGWTVYSLFDGHGEAGHWPAVRSSKTLPYFLQASASCSTMLKQGKVKAALFHAFEKVQMDLVKQSVEEDFSLQVCGCTAVCILQHPDYDTVWVANLGDSKAVMISPTTHGVVAETVDHKPSVASERERVERSGMELQTTIHDDGFVEERLFIKGEEFPGLCMTRSLGDLCVKQHGITAEPEIVTWDVKSYPDSYMLLATDGVWDFLSGDEVSEIVLECTSNGGTLEDATAKLLAAAKERWSDYDESYCDDITLILIPAQGRQHTPGDEVHWKSVQEGCCSGLKKSGCALM